MFMLVRIFFLIDDQGTPKGGKIGLGDLMFLHTQRKGSKPQTIG